MRTALMRIVFCALVLALSAGHAVAQWGFGYPAIPDEPLCSDYIRAWIAMAKDAEARKCSPGGPVWSTDVKTQADFCLSAGVDANNARTEDMRSILNGGTASLCEGCAHEADIALNSVIDNILYSCGFSNSDGRWTPSKESQIARCIAANKPYAQGSATYFKIKSQMAEEVRVCKLTHQRRGCISCHDSQSSSAAVQPMPKSGNALHDPVRQLQDRAKLKDVKVVDPCKPGTRSFDISCKQPPTKASNSSAMDSLQGLSPGAPSGTREQGASSSKPAATTAPSAPAAPSAPSLLFNKTR
jgi:hypothetical protein